MSEQKAQQVPSIGRIVHVVSKRYGGNSNAYEVVHLPAIVTVAPTEANPDPVLVILGGERFGEQVVSPYDATGQTPESWHWPDYIPATPANTGSTPSNPGVVT